MKNGLKSILFVVLYIVISASVSSLVFQVIHFPNWKYYSTQILNFVVYIITILICVFIKIFRKENYLKECNFSPPKLKDIVQIVFVTISFYLLLSYLNHTTGLFITKHRISHSTSMFFSGNRFILFLFGCLFVPISNELFERGVLLNELKKGLSNGFSVLILALLIGFLFMKTGFAQMFSFTILFSIVYLWFKSIWAPIIANIIINFLELFIRPDSIIMKLHSGYNSLYFKLPLLIMVVCCIYLIWKNHRTIFRKDSC